MTLSGSLGLSPAELQQMGKIEGSPVSAAAAASMSPTALPFDVDDLDGRSLTRMSFVHDGGVGVQFSLVVDGTTPVQIREVGKTV